MFSLLSELSTEQHPRNNQLAHNMIGEHVHTVSFLKNIMDQADMMTENTAIVISQESEGLVEVETNFEAPPPLPTFRQIKDENEFVIHHFQILNTMG